MYGRGNQTGFGPPVTPDIIKNLIIANGVVFISSITLAPKSTQRFVLTLPKDTFGTITLQSSSDALVFRNYVKRGDEYVLPFSGQ